MLKAMIVLLMGLGATAQVHADVYLGQTDNGALLLTNLPRAGQQYQRVFSEPQKAASRTAGKVSTLPMSERPFVRQVEQAAQANELPSALLHAVIRHESNYDPAALSPKGAAGLMQLMPGTARDLGVADVWDPAANIDGGARYLKQLLERFDQDIPLALAAYNAGPGAVLNHGRTIPPYVETLGYVPRVMNEYQHLLGAMP